MSKEIQIKQECCDIWNNLKDKSKMIDYLIESKQQIADLEAKLAELREQIAIRDEENSKTFMQSVNAMRENVELKQQLAEKEKEIESLGKQLDFFTNRFRSRSFKRTGDWKRDFIEHHNQDKISFALEQLEKAKNKIESKVESIYKILDDLNIKIVGESTSRELNAYEEIAKDIDNQIKQLKEGK